MSRTLIVVALSLFAAYGSSALADDLGLGDGHDGELVVTSTGVVVNRYATLGADVGSGEATVTVSSTADFAVGDVVMLHQAQRALAPPASGDQSDVDAAAIGVGAYELFRIASIDSVASTLTFAAAVEGSFFAPGAQVVRVPEYTTLRVQGAASLTAPAYNGETGGVVAVLVQGAFENAGIVTTTGRGFRGGVMVNNASFPSGCSDVDEPAPAGQQKGEGIYRGRYGADATGTGNVANGAGGAVCVNAGGAGGGGAGQGGHGGASWDGARIEAGGRGGAAVSTRSADLLVFGGGGGAGHGNDNVATSGGAGGGAIFVRAGAVLGDGELTASGSSAANTGGDGGGGGGGGGSVVARVVEEASCYSWSAAGGNGASVAGGHGPGGGGGGGRVLLRAASGVCPVSVLAGLAGVTGNPGATPTNASDPLHVGVADVPPVPAAVERPTFYYGRGVGSSNSLRVVGMVDGTTYTIRDINTDVVLASGTINRFQQLTQAINGRHFKVEASQPLLAILYLSTNGGTFFLPAEGSNARTGRRFVLHHPGAARFLCYAYEPSEAVIRRSDDSVFATRSMPAYSLWEPGIAANTSYTLTGTGRMACQALAINAYDTVPDKSGGDVGTDFLFGTHSWSPGGGYAVIAYDDSDVIVSDIATGAEVQRFSLVAGSYFHRSDLSNARLHLTSTGRVSVWAGDHEGGSTIGYMGDDLAFHNGIGGREFYIHTQIVGATVFASSDDTVVEVDGVATTLASDQYLDLAANQFVHLLASKPVIVQTFGGGSLNDYANVLRAVPAGPVSSLGVTLSLTEVQAGLSLDVTVVARDASAGVDVGYRGTVGFSSLDPSAILPAGYTFSEADQGQRTFFDGVALTRSGQQVVLVEDRDNPALRGEASLVVVPGPLDAATSTISVSPATVDANGVEEAEITVIPRDAYGNRLGAGLAVVVAASAGTLDPLVVDAADGSYLVRLTAPPAPAMAIISAEVDGVVLDEEAVVDFVVDQSAPAGVTLASGAVTETSAALSYTESSSADAVGYELSRYDARGDLVAVEDLAAANGTTVTGLSACTRYGFEVRAYDAAGNRSVSSNRVEMETVLDGAPLAPSGLVAEPRDSYVRLRWDPSASCDAASYRVYRSDAAGGPYTLVADDVDGFAALDLYLANGQTFYYVVTTVDAEGIEGGYSAEVSASPTAADPGAPVESLLATALPGGFIELSWLLPVDADALGFRVYRSDAPIVALADAVLVAEPSNPSALDLPPADGDVHYTVTWIDVVGSESYPAASVQATSDRVPPSGTVVVEGAGPYGIGAVALSLTVDEDLPGTPALFVSWPDVTDRELPVTADAIDQRLFGSVVVIEEGDPEALAALSARLVDATGNVGSALLGEVELVIDGVRPTAVVATSPPELLPIGTASVTLTAREALAATPSLSLQLESGALVDVALAESAPPEPAHRFVGSLEVLDTMASGGAQFVVSLTDESGNGGSFLTAGEALVVDTVLPLQPTALVASVGSLGSVLLTWRAPSSDADASYVLYRDDVEIIDVTGLAPVQIGIAATSTSDLPPADGTWFYAVAAVDRAGNRGPPSASVEATSDQTAPGAPTGLSAAPRDAVVDLAWTPPDGEAPVSYAVFRSTASFQGLLAGHSPSIPATQSTSVSDRPPGEGRYHYVVAARDRVGLLSAPSNEVEVLFDNHAPTIVVENVAEGGHYASAVQPIVTISDVTLSSSSVTLDGAPFLSGDIVSAEGAHTLVATASDAAGRSSTRTVPFVLDFTAPEIEIAGVSEGGHFESAPTVTFSATDSHLVEVSARLDGVAYASGTPVITDGFHSLVVTARDRAGNVATASVGFSVDLPPAAVRGVIAVIEEGAIDLSWSPALESDVVEYRVLRDGALIAAPGEPSAGGGAAPQAPERARFEIRAVDAAGHVGPARSFSVSAVRLALVAYGTPDGAGGSSLTRGYFDDVALQVMNDDITALEAGPPRFELLDNEDVSWWEEAGVAEVTVPGGGAALLDDVLYAHPELDPADNTLVADVELPAPAEVRVVARARFPIEMRFPPGATVEPVHGTLVRGAEADIQVRATNHGSAPLDLINAGAGGTASPDLEVRLLHPDGRVLASASVVDVVEGSVRASGERVSTLEPGASRTYAPVRLLIPGDAPDNILLEVEAKQIHSRFGSEGHRVEDGFLYSRARNVVPPPYLVTATTDKPEYNQGELVFISGVATDTESGATAADVVARVIVGNGGFEQSFYVRTNADGVYQLPFSSGPVAAGLFTVSAVHPTVLTREQDATFLVHGLRLDPGSFQLTLSKGASFPVTMTLRNSGASAITGIGVALNDAVADDSVTALVENAPLALAPGASATFSLTVSAEQAAADTAAFDLSLTNDQGATRQSRIDVALYAAAPSLVATPRFLDVGVAAGTSTVRTVVIENRGYGTWLAAQVVPPADTPWILVPTGAALGDIAPGERASFDVLFVPPDDEPSRLVSTSLTLTSANIADVPLFVGANVTASGEGAVEVMVTNLIYAVTEPDRPVSGARVRLLSQDNFTLWFEGTTDLVGRASFPVVPAGRYSYVVSADGFQTVTAGADDAEAGAIVVEPGQTTPLSVGLVESFVDVSFSVTPTTVEDQYDIAVDTTYETHVPIPVLLVTPHTQHFDMKPGTTRTGQIQITNLGLVSAFNVELNPSQDHYLDVQYQFRRIAEIPAQSSVVVPFTVYLKTHASPPPEPCTDFGADFYLAYEWYCDSAGTLQQQVVPGVNLSVTSHEANVQVEPSVILRPTFINCPGTNGFVDSVPPTVATTNMEGSDVQICDCGRITTRGLSFPQIAQIVDILKALSDERYVDFCNEVMSMVGAPTCDDAVSGAYDAAGASAFGDDWDDVKQTVSDVEDVISTAEQLSALLKSLSEGECAGQSTLDALESLLTSLGNKANKKIMNDLLDEYGGGKIGFDQSVAYFDTACLASGQTAYVDLAAGGGVGAGTAQFSVQHGCGPDVQCCPVTVPYVDLLVICTIDSIGIASQGGMLPSEPGSGGPNYWYPGYSFPWSSDYCAVPL